MGDVHVFVFEARLRVKKVKKELHYEKVCNEGRDWNHICKLLTLLNRLESDEARIEDMYARNERVRHTSIL
jgi:hypothetical protein